MLDRDRSLDQAEFDQFRKFLQEACGIFLGENKQYLVTTRIKRILLDNNLASVGELVSRLQSGMQSALRQQVIDAMTTNETFWFRDSYPYEYLSSVLLPKWMAETDRKPLRIWSAACSSGQEPYSLSIIIEEYRRRRGTLSRPVDIVATDLSANMLRRAQQGVYERLEVIRGLSDDRLRTFFREVEPGFWHINADLKQRVQFRSLNLLDSYSSLGQFDVIYCRNVLIYFTGETKRDILRRLHGCLRPGGMLLLGSSESIAGMGEFFEMVHCNPGIAYRAR